ncbi:MAG: hypothetical protein ACRD0P_27370, partial [Stackebrandtia sp.]
PTADNVGVYVAPPGDASTAIVGPTSTITITDKGQSKVQDAMDGLIDECADSEKPAPEGCPFAATAQDDDTVDTDDETYSSVDDVAWKVDDYPKMIAQSAAPPDGFRLLRQDNATIDITATGDSSADDSDDRVTFTVHCDFDVSGFTATASASGNFSVSMVDHGYVLPNCSS